MDITARDALFISHATPEDNAFTLWLGAKLTALGYSVFADVLRLRGGNDWERILEDAIRNRAAKVLLVATPLSVQKQGVRNEINIANQTARKHGLDSFIIPLRLAEYEPQLQVAHAQFLDFSKSWAAGLKELLAQLDELNIPKVGGGNHVELWRGVQLKDARAVGPGPERLVSNWLEIESIPSHIRFFDFKAGISIGLAQKAMKECPLPIVQQGRGFISFALLHQLQDYFGHDLPVEVKAEASTNDFLRNGWSHLQISWSDARARFADLSRQALDAFFRSKGLNSSELASNTLAWWPTSEQAGLRRLSFRWNDGPSGSRQIVGRSVKRRFYWHYGVSCRARLSPIRHIRVTGRVIFTTDGTEQIGDARRLHRMRRSFCKSWRNDKWRDLLLAFWFWLAGGSETVDIPMGADEPMRLRLPPVAFVAPFGVNAPDDAGESEDDDGGDIDDTRDDEDDIDDEADDLDDV